MLNLIYTSTKTLTALTAPVALVYLAAWDALILRAGSKLYKLFRDGTLADLGAPAAYTFLLNRTGGRHAWGLTTNPYQFYGADEITGQYAPADLLNPDWGPALGYAQEGNLVDDAGGYWLRPAMNKVEVYRLRDGLHLGDIALSWPGGIPDNLAALGPGRALALDMTTGALVLVDYVNRAVLFTSQVGACLAGAFDSRHNLVITIGPDLKIRVYALEAVPAALSDPEFTGAPVRALAGYPVRVCLTGGAGEPCPGRLVHWELLGGVGALEQAASLTAADGYADNFYFGPESAPASETIRALVNL
jgi:hypothetical protein